MNTLSIQRQILSNNESLEVLTSAIDDVAISGNDWRILMVEQLESENRKLIAELEKSGIFAA